VDERATNRSPELDEVRRLLFPELSPDDGWTRIDRAFTGAADPERWQRIESLAHEPFPADAE